MEGAVLSGERVAREIWPDRADGLARRL